MHSSKRCERGKKFYTTRPYFYFSNFDRGELELIYTFLYGSLAHCPQPLESLARKYRTVATHTTQWHAALGSKCALSAVSVTSSYWGSLFQIIRVILWGVLKIYAFRYLQSDRGFIKTNNFLIIVFFFLHSRLLYIILLSLLYKFFCHSIVNLYSLRNL